MKVGLVYVRSGQVMCEVVGLLMLSEKGGRHVGLGKLGRV